ncbi:MAG: hypothetical protein RLZZ450_6844 [Pseudomonadota bacterium]
MLALYVLLVSAPGAARAFSDPELFAQPALRGGGGGRFFTGSPADGHACSVCHRGGVEPVVGVSGLPEVLDVGVQYEVTLRWTHPEIAHGLQLELLTEGSVSPVLELPLPALLTSGARCESSAQGDPAVYVTEAAGRKIVGVRDCGASELTFRFVAPSARRVAFSASIVRSNSSGTAEGDGVRDLRRVIYARGQAPDESGCHLTNARSRPRGDLVLLLFVLAWCVGRARRPSSPAVDARRGSVRRCAGGVVLAAATQLFSCYQPDHSADYTPWPVVRADGAAPVDLDAATNLRMDADLLPALDARVSADDAQQTETPRLTQLTFRVLTAPVGGRYAPRNIGAIWVEQDDGTFVKSLARWALTRAMYLRRFEAVFGGDLTDATTSATLEVHQQHEVRWNLTGRGGIRVPNGRYRLVLELTDKDSRGLSLEVPFELADAPLVLEPAVTAQFKDMRLELR